MEAKRKGGGEELDTISFWAYENWDLHYDYKGVVKLSMPHWYIMMVNFENGVVV